ncbi:Leucine-rich repeat-containing protein 47 [Dirofilaria immitis]|nr:Leucine-rich repeat-containing protein 47 [Dirofilaria immitis]
MSDDSLLLEWPELKRIIEENRCELNLTSIPIGKRNPDINDERLQSKIFAPNTPLNYIELTRLELRMLHTSVGKASKLKKLILHSNALVVIPENIGDLKNYNFLIYQQTNLINFQQQSISFLPDMSGLVSLQHLDVSYNQLAEFPTLFPNQSKLHTLILNSNHIRELPAEMGSLNDNLKIDPRHKTLALIDYMKRKAPKTSRKNNDEKESKPSNINRNECISNASVITINYGVNSLLVEKTKEVSEIRPYIVCCVLKNCSLNAEKMKQLLNIQNKLHSSVCGERTIGSIGTHNFRKLQPPLIYGAVDPDILMITPLHRHKKVSGQELLSNLTNEAELIRKRKNETWYQLPLYPCLMDANGLIISIPPVTNCEETKLDVDTKDILVEVTSTVTESTCLEIMDKFIEEIVMQKCLTNLIIEQTKVRQHNGELLVAYPSKNDLQIPNFIIKRELVVGGSNMCGTSKPGI